MDYLPIITQLSTLAVTMAFVSVAWFFHRGRADRIMNALFLFFATSAVVFGSMFITEGVFNISVSEQLYGKLRPIMVRGVMAITALWLVWQLWFKNGRK